MVADFDQILNQQIRALKNRVPFHAISLF